MPSLDDLLAKMVEVHGSDLHLKVGSPPMIRIDGNLQPIDLPPVAPADTEAWAQSVMPPRAVASFRDLHEADFAYGKAQLGRFRVNVYRQRTSVSIVIRAVQPASKSFGELGLPPIMSRLAQAPRGLLLVTGPTGSGKTTTMAAMVDAINSTRRVNIITIEDPIEVLHPDKMALVSQRELGVDTVSFDQALRRVLRQDPDVILIGEIRDKDTAEAAIQAADTGHLVLSSLHTLDATETINRLLDFFPPFQHQGIRLMLAGTLQGIVSQRLIPKADGIGRVPATEVLTSNPRVFDRIVDSEKTHTLRDLIEDGEFYGMHSFDQALMGLYQKGVITYDDALSHASNASDFKVKLQQKIRPPEQQAS
ncbi:MAG: PilT/PilU family type 4a pilus ATPase [Acidimicrobiia bacterium]|nr:PilT/PilU family type 4a pilus ATPase [Acidimicrobiia bacterium]